MQGIRDRWWFIALTVLVCIGGAQAVLRATEPLYEAVTTFSIAAVPTEDDVLFSSGASDYVSARAQSYATIMQRPSFRNSMVNRLPAPVEGAYPQLETVLAKDTVLLEVTVTDTDPQRAMAMAVVIGKAVPELAAAVDPARPNGIVPIRVQIVEQPLVPAEPVSPDTTVYWAGGLLLGALLGAAGAVLLARNDDRVRRARDLARAHEPLPILGHVGADKRSRRADPRARQETFHMIYARLLYYAPATPRFVLVTSAVAGEGKTLVATEIAKAAARSGQRVLLLGGDLRNPEPEVAMPVAQSAGLVGVLLEGVPHRLAVTSTDVPGLDVLPAGREVDNPLRLITDPAMSRLLEDLATDYSLVIIDAPAVLPYADAPLLAAGADATIVVSRLKRVRLRQLNLMREQLNRAGAVVMGTVVTGGPHNHGDEFSPTHPSPAGERDGQAAPADLNGRRSGVVVSRNSDSGAPLGEEVQPGITASRQPPQDPISAATRQTGRSSSDGGTALA